MLKVGIVGLPNVGKSTLFTALTKKQVACENFPFCTIEPNVGVVEVPDERIERLVEISKSEKKIPTAIEFVDIAGLVAGAHKGEGLGNKFLANIRETDLIAHVVRAFEDSNVHHVDGSVNPLRDVEVIELELIMADLATVEKRLNAIDRKAIATKDQILLAEVAVLQRYHDALSAGRPANSVILTEEERETVPPLHLLTEKRVLYIVNVDEDAARDPNWQSPLGPERLAIPVSVKIEAELAALSDDEAREMLIELGMAESGLDRVIKKAYELLDLVTFFTSGEKETRAWTITKGMKAPQAAGKIHTDFEKGFIRAEVIAYDDFIVAGGEAKAREAGTLRVEGKEYVVKDGDLCHFRFNV